MYKITYPDPTVCNKRGATSLFYCTGREKIQTTAEKGDDCLVVTPDLENLHLERANPAANFLNDDRQISQVFFVSFVLGSQLHSIISITSTWLSEGKLVAAAVYRWRCTL